MSAEISPDIQELLDLRKKIIKFLFFKTCVTLQ